MAQESNDSGDQSTVQERLKIFREDPADSISSKSFWITLLLCWFLGITGAHKFYVGKSGKGFLMLFTLGGLGIWMLIDLFAILTSRFTDGTGAPIKQNIVGYND